MMDCLIDGQVTTMMDTWLLFQQGGAPQCFLLYKYSSYLMFKNSILLYSSPDNVFQIDQITQGRS